MDTEKVTAESVIRRIERAFVKVRLRYGVSMAQARAADDWKPQQEGLRARKQDREKTWSDIPDEKIEKYCDVLPWLDGDGFKFYLPAFMRWTLRHPDHSNVAGEYTVRALTPIEQTKRGVVIRENDVNRYKLLDKQQREVVVAFLVFVAENIEHWADSARTALLHYWNE